MDWPNFFTGIFYSLLPREFRGSWRPSSTVDFSRSTMVSGLLECLGFLYLIAIGYVHFLGVRAQQMRAASAANEGTQLYFFVIVTLEYAIHPLTLIGLFLAGEGALRAWAAFFTDEVVPSLPLKLMALLRDRRLARKREAEIGPPIPDLVERMLGEDSELRVSSQMPKEGWRTGATIAVHDELYEVNRVEDCAGVRPVRYVLRKFPKGKVIRGGYRYDPSE